MVTLRDQNTRTELRKSKTLWKECLTDVIVTMVNLRGEFWNTFKGKLIRLNERLVDLGL